MTKQLSTTSGKDQKDNKKVIALREELLTMIEKTMEKENISQAEVARRIEAQRYNVNKILRRKFPVSLDFLVKMAESIGLDVDLKVRKIKD